MIRNNSGKKIYLWNITRTNMSAFFWLPYWSNTSLVEQRSYIHMLLQLLSKATVIMYVNFLHTTVKMGVLVFKVLSLISTTLQWHMLTPSESTFLLWICTDSLSGFWMSVIHSRIQISHLWNSLCQSTTLLYVLVWSVLTQF